MLDIGFQYKAYQRIIENKCLLLSESTIGKL